LRGLRAKVLGTKHLTLLLTSVRSWIFLHARLVLFAFKLACLPLKIICEVSESGARRSISQSLCDFPNMRRFIAQSLCFVHDTAVLVTGGSVRNLSSGGRRISQPLMPGVGPYQR
jgi:hypothetical protein